MNGLDPNNNYGGGKVKFFTGGTGGGGQTIRLLPIMIGSNNATTISEGGMIPLNATEFFNDGGDSGNEYDGTNEATSYLPQIDNPYYYYLTSGVIQAVNLTNAEVDLELILDGIVTETISCSLVGGNSYTSLFAFSIPSELNQYAVERYGILVTQTSGTATKFLLNTTNVFLSVYDENELKSEFFTSSNLNVLEIVNGDNKYFGFGGQTNANSSGAIPLVRSVVGDTALTQVLKVYFMLSQSVNLLGDSIKVELYIDDVYVEEFLVFGNIPAYTPQEFTLTTPTDIANRGTTYINIVNQSEVSIYLFEVGICGYEILD
jgi:hypothetical protein